jgi:DNA-binding response OmpR family regulator
MQKTKGTIWLIEDSDAIRKSFCALFYMNDYKTVEFSDGSIAWDHFKVTQEGPSRNSRIGKPDILIIDGSLSPHGIDGVELIGYIREINNTTPIIFLSGANEYAGEWSIKKGLA